MMFYNCTALKSVNIPNSVTKIDFFAFSGCDSLEEIEIPIGVREIKESAFRGCKSLVRIVIPEGVTEIEKDTFNDCKALKTIMLPKCMKKIGDSAFGFAGIENVYFDGTAKEAEKIEIGKWNFTVGIAKKVYVKSLFGYTQYKKPLF